MDDLALTEQLQSHLAQQQLHILQKYLLEERELGRVLLEINIHAHKGAKVTGGVGAVVIIAHLVAAIGLVLLVGAVIAG